MENVIDMLEYLDSKVGEGLSKKPTFISTESFTPDTSVLDTNKLRKRHRLKEKYYTLRMHYINIGVDDYYNKTHRDIDGNK